MAQMNSESPLRDLHHMNLIPPVSGYDQDQDPVMIKSFRLWSLLTWYKL